MRTCSKCGVTKPADTEHFNRHRNGLRPECKPCQRAAGRAYKAANRDRINAKAAAYRAARREELARKAREYHHANRGLVLAKMRESSLLRDYGITAEQYAAILDLQNGCCAICERPPGDRQLAVDHDHETGQVRGLLCTRCNTALGTFGDSEAGLLRALAYLREHPSRVSDEIW